MIALAGQAPHDEQFAARAAAGVLGLDPLAAVIGQTAPKTEIEPITDLVEAVMTTQPYASARRVFDNGSSHNGQSSIDRMQAAWPTQPWSTY